MSLGQDPAAAPRFKHGETPAIAYSGRGIGFRIVLIIVITSAVAIGSIAMSMASQVAFSRVLMTTVDSRLLEIANEISGHVDDSLQAGVALGKQRRLLEVMDQERSRAPELDTLRVADDRAVIVFSTNRAEIGESLAPLSHEMQSSAVDGASHGTIRHQSRDFISLERPIEGLFGADIGKVIVALPMSVVDDQRQRYATSLALGVVAITAIGGLLAALVIYLAPLSQVRALDALCQRMNGLFMAAAGAPASEPPARTPLLKDEFAAFEQAANARLSGLAQREATLQALDDGA